MRIVVLVFDLDFIIDLRYFNKGCLVDIFEVFFDILDYEFEELKVVDERRYGVEYILRFLFVRDLIS